MRNFLKKIFLILFVPLLFFGFIELTLRVFNIEVNTGEGPLEETKLFNFNLSSSKEKVDRDIFIETGPKIYSVYSRRYRCKINERNRQSNEYIILTLGDSCTYGFGVERNQTFSYYLEGFLNRYNDNIKFKVFNFGFPGYSSFQGLKFLNKYIKMLRPDLVVAYFGANDGCYAPFYSDREFDQRQNAMIIKTHNFLYKNVKFYRLVRNLNLIYFRKLVDKSFTQPLNKKFQRRRVSPSEFLENLKNMKKLCEQNKCKIIYIWHCWYIKGKLVRHKEYKPLEPYIDLCGIYKKRFDKVNKYYLDHCHPSKLGHQLIAEAIAEEVERIIKHDKRYVLQR